ncbi:MAG: tyrosine--tRNA ligase [Thermoguttaceae bacterium]|nr:tyrosine--tRNA ligase [Thermoguttaceae bacterium]
MTKPVSDVIAELRWRKQIFQTTDDTNISAWLMEKPRALYAGFDPTADSLHVGHLMALMILRRFQKAGHRPIALVGGATGMIGDPSGKSAERKQLTPETVAYNVECIKKQVGRFLDFGDGPEDAVLVNNYDWLANKTFIEFLRDVGKCFPVNAMLAKDSVRSRLERENGLSYTEFSYMLLQSYDFVHLYREFGCELQVGGSDQWGNITTGIDLARRMEGVQLYGMTAPLLTKSDGTKMGKTESGALWLDAEKCSPYQFYQYWMNVEDSEVVKLLSLMTDLEREEVESITAAHLEAPEKRFGQRRAAEEITRLVHGDDGLAAAQKATEIFFGAEIKDLKDEQLRSIFKDVPSAEFTRAELEAGIGIGDALVKSGVAKTKSDVRRASEQGGLYVNNQRVADIRLPLTVENLASESTIVLRMGKKKYSLVVIR